MPEITAHPEMLKGLEGPMTDDRNWFHQRPGEVIRFRPLLPDELEVQTTFGRMAGADGPPAIHVTTADGRRPLTHALVIDWLRLNGIPHPPDGESCRFRFCCPDPSDPQRRFELVEAALRLLATRLRPKSRRRRGGHGFGDQQQEAAE